MFSEVMSLRAVRRISMHFGSSNSAVRGTEWAPATTALAELLRCNWANSREGYDTKVIGGVG